MEIISYVQAKPQKRRINLAGLQPKLRERSSRNAAKSVTYQPFSPELRTFAAQKVHKSVSVKNFFKIVGAALDEAGDYISSNVKKISIAVISLCAISTLVYEGFHLANQKTNYTGPLALQTGDLDIENLNKLMSAFALEGTNDIDESGNILDSHAAVQHFSQPVTFQTYKVRSGDTIGGIAKKFGLTNISTLISVNDIGNVRQLAAGQKLRIPSIDGIVYTVKAGDSLNSIIQKHKVKLDDVLDVNDLTTDTLTKGQQLFLPGVGLDSNTLKSAMGDMFRMPLAAKFRWSSPYGERIDPIAGVKSFHTGTDMACPTGTPILASMSGKVTAAGVNRVYGNYVIIDHGNGYQTLYAHMSKIIATKGQWVSQGTRIGLVGSTGYSTGPHLHFTVYKNGKLINPMSVLNK